VIAKPAGRSLGRHPPEGRKPAPGDRAGTLELAVGVERAERRGHERRRHAAGVEIRGEPRGTVATRGARLHEVARERRVVDVAARGEIGDDGFGNLARRAAPDEPAREITLAPRAA